MGTLSPTQKSLRDAEALVPGFNIGAIDYPKRIKFIETFLDIRDRRSNVRPFILSQAQHNYIKAKANALRRGEKPWFLILKSRKVGITTLEQGESFEVASQTPYQHCVTLADSAGNTKKIFEIAQLFFEKAWGPAKPTGSYHTTEELRFHDRTSIFWIGTAGSKGFARGQTVQRAHGSEVAWWPGTLDYQRNLMAGLEGAAEFGEVVLESTANGCQGLFYDKWQDAKRGESEYTPIFITWWMDPKNWDECASGEAKFIMNDLDDEELLLVSKHGLLPQQIKFRRRKKGSLKALFPQEYPEDDVTAFRMSGVIFFDGQLVRAMVPLCKPPIRRAEQGKLQIWAEPEEGRRYVIGADPAGGYETSDFCAAGVLDFETGEQVARLHGRWRPYRFAEKLDKLGRMYNSAMLGVEVQNHGHAVLEALIHVHRYPRRDLYFHRHYDSRTRITSKRVGWSTNSETRPVMLDGLARALEDGGMRVNDPDFLQECLVFVDRGGRYEAAEGENDDLIFAWGIANRVRQSRPPTPQVF